MAQPKTGWMNREWVVEAITSKAYAAGSVAIFDSQHKGIVSEAYPIGAYTYDHGTILVAGPATVIAHDESFPSLGSIGATQAATLSSQRFLVAGLAGTQTQGVFLIRGR